jgi:hypothetical protein
LAERLGPDDRLAIRRWSGPYSAGVSIESARIAFEGLVNARDLGGLPVAGGGSIRRGVLYRSETPELMSPADVTRAIDDLGLRRTIDLRGQRGRGYPLGDGGRRAAIDFFALAGADHHLDGSDDGFLPSALVRGGVPVGRVLELLVDAGGPCLIHCHTGKDRTGFVVAMTLALVGVPDEHIIADYEASTPVYEAMVANLEAVGLGVPASAPAYARRPPSPAGIRAMLARLRADWPSARAYLEGQGVPPGLCDRVVELLVEPAP